MIAERPKAVNDASGNGKWQAIRLGE